MKITLKQLAERKCVELPHYFECSHCGFIRRGEGEVACWKCGLGDMVWLGSDIYDNLKLDLTKYLKEEGYVKEYTKFHDLDEQYPGNEE